ncbi:membrane protein insertase YidC [Aliagarivorans taiwanensis]|uniref:membrane protein insertase YidC n=1 Tax=Aliagarivorans taiwanensis TaxID=561966 RepID=UPI000412D9C0|nr:membrane protein insertase YidC [Aliagarivorans taiwanensis]
MESQRNFLIIGLLFVSFLIFQQWQMDYGPQPVTVSESVEQTLDTPSSTNTDVPSSPNMAATEASSKTIEIKSDVLKLEITTRGGDITSAKLLQHTVEQDSDQPFVLLEESSDFAYIAQSGLIGRNGPDANPNGRPIFAVEQDSFELDADADQLVVPLTYLDEQGNEFVKTFTLNRGSYRVEVDYNITNNSDQIIAVQPYAQLKQNPSSEGRSMVMPVYRGGAYSSDSVRYKKYSFDDMAKNNLSITTQGGWVAMMQHYFVSAWLPNPDQQNELYSDNKNGFAFIGYKAPEAVIQPQQSVQLDSAIWIGPKDQAEMAKAARHLNLTVDYGWLWFLAQPLFKLLNFFHGIVGNWGVAIILITFTVKGALYPLTKAQYTSMAKMRMLQPQLMEIREKYGDDRQKSSQAMMELYKKEKVNPLGGCLPILLQMPIFIALYWSLMESVELRHAPFFLWITDLSVQDPYYILPILMGASMFLIQKMSPTTVTDPMQQKMMTFMPLIFMVFFLWFPAGLVLYWLMSNIVTLIQQTLIYRNLEKKGLSTKKK